ncbi:unnamed protein product, partial [Hapterophycus canaliculatus]
CAWNNPVSRFLSGLLIPNQKVGRVSKVTETRGMEAWDLRGCCVRSVALVVVVVWGENKITTDREANPVGRRARHHHFLFACFIVGVNACRRCASLFPCRHSYSSERRSFTDLFNVEVR